MKDERNIVLASASPRRLEIFKAHGIQPMVRPTDTDETLPPNVNYRDAVMFLAWKKAKAAEAVLIKEREFPEGTLIVASDTVVNKNGIMGKPQDRQDAYRMLSRIKNTSHQVASGVAALRLGQSNSMVTCCVTNVFCKDVTEDCLNAYLNTDEPYDKAGAYAIQGLFGKYIDRIEGDYDNVVGFPWETFESAYKHWVSLK